MRLATSHHSAKFLIDHPDLIFRVEKGSIDLFAIELVDGLPHGRHLFLRDCKEGELLFGVHPSSDYALGVVAGPGTELSSFTPDALTQHVALLETGLNQWMLTLFSRFEPIEIGVTHVDLKMAVEEKKWQPLLDSIHHTFFQTLVQRAAAEEIKERERIAQKEEKEGLLFTQSLEALTSVLGEEERESFAEIDPLMRACAILAKEQGFTLQKPLQRPSGEVRRRLSEIATTSNIFFREVSLKELWWSQESEPMLAFRKSDLAPLALVRDKNKFVAIDPLTYSKHKVDAAFAAEILPYAYIFYPSLPREAITWREMLRFGFDKKRKGVLGLILVGVVAALLNLFFPIASKVIFGMAIPQLNTTVLWQVGAAFFVAAFSSSLYQITRGLFVVRVAAGVGTKIEAAFWERLLKLPVQFFSRYSRGNLWTRLNALATIRKSFYSNSFTLILAAFFSVLYLPLMLIYSPKLALLGVCTLVLCVIIAYYVINKASHLQGGVFEGKGQMQGYLLQVIQGIAKLKTAGAERRAFAHFATQFAAVKKTELAVQSYQVSLTTLTALFQTFATLVIFAMIIFEVMANPDAQMISAGNFFGFMAAFGAFTAAILAALPAAFELFGQLKPSWKHAKVIVEALPEADPRKNPMGDFTGHLVVDEVHFRYEENGPFILRNVSLEIRPGEFVALVGSSGCGKSTLIRLLLGFDVPEKGSIFYDANDMAHIDIRSLRKQLGVVLQDGALLAGTIYENLSSSGLFGKEEVERAIRLSGFEEDLKDFPMGLHTVLPSGGSTLSGGQKQRLLIARALVSNPKMLFFDEATSALDNRTQDLVSKNIEKLAVSRLVIAHRLGTIQNADRIYVLDKGEIVDVGTFNELASRPGLFANLVKRQRI